MIFIAPHPASRCKMGAPFPEGWARHAFLEGFIMSLHQDIAKHADDTGEVKA
jgi:hypothetical protein